MKSKNYPQIGAIAVSALMLFFGWAKMGGMDKELKNQIVEGLNTILNQFGVSHMSSTAFSPVKWADIMWSLFGYIRDLPEWTAELFKNRVGTGVYYFMPVFTIFIIAIFVVAALTIFRIVKGKTEYRGIQPFMIMQIILFILVIIFCIAFANNKAAAVDELSYYADIVALEKIYMRPTLWAFIAVLLSVPLSLYQPLLARLGIKNTAGLQAKMEGVSQSITQGAKGAASIMKEKAEKFQGGKSWVCPNCGQEVEKGSRFCPHCGTEKPAEPEPRFCHMCGTKLAADVLFCPNCGAIQILDDEPAFRSVPVEPVMTEAPAAPYAAPYEPVAPVEPAAPYEAAAPDEVAEPYEPAAPVEPAAPYEAVEPFEPVAPAEPAAPEAPFEAVAFGAAATETPYEAAPFEPVAPAAPYEAAAFEPAAPETPAEEPAEAEPRIVEAFELYVSESALNEQAAVGFTAPDGSELTICVPAGAEFGDVVEVEAGTETLYLILMPSEE